MKQNEIQKCANCGEGVAKGNVYFYRLRIEQMILNRGAIERQHGLEMMLGAAAPLAQAFGLDEDIAVGVSDITVLICADCALSDRLFIHVLLEDGK